MRGAQPASGHGEEKLDADVSVLGKEAAPAPVKKKEAAPAGRDSGSPVVGSPAVHSLWLGTVQFGKPGSVQAATPAARRRENIFFLSILKTAIVKK
jgi:hypothetical protein